MKLSKMIAVALVAVFCAGSLLAADREISLTRNTQSGHLSGNFELRPMADGSFDDYVRFDTKELRSVSTDILRSGGISWTSLSISYGDKSSNNFSDDSNDSKRKKGSFTDSETGFYTLHLKGNVNHGSNLNNGEQEHYRVEVSAVPEPETYAMLLAGLSVLGYVSRRRSQCGAVPA